MLELALALIAVGGLVAAFGGGQVSAALLAGAVGVAAAFARLAFDAIVQRDAPDANRGRAFAQFETKFQMAWVLAAFVPVLLPIPRSVGFLIVDGARRRGAGVLRRGLAAHPRGPATAADPRRAGRLQGQGAPAGAEGPRAAAASRSRRRR